MMENISDKIRTSLRLPPLQRALRPPLSVEQYLAHFDFSGRIIALRNYRRDIFYSGFNLCMTTDVWRVILGVFPRGCDVYQRDSFISDASQQYYRSKLQLLLQTQNNELPEITKRQFKLIRADVVKAQHERLNLSKGGKDPCIHLYEMLCVYVLTHPSIGYYEGMVDMASLMLVIQDQEASAYLSFCAYMKRVSRNFSDPEAIQEQCRMIFTLLDYFDSSLAQCLKTQENDLVPNLFRDWVRFELRKEFSYPDVVRVLEMQWVTCMSINSKGVSLSEKDSAVSTMTGRQSQPAQQRVRTWLLGEDRTTLDSDSTSTTTENIDMLSDGQSTSRDGSSWFNAISTSYSTTARSDSRSVCSDDSLWTVVASDQQEKSRETSKPGSKRPPPPNFNHKAITNPFLLFISVSIVIEYRSELQLKALDGNFSAAVFLQNKTKRHNCMSVLSRAVHLLKRYLHEHRRRTKPAWSSFLH